MLKIINSAIENTREPTGQYFSHIMGATETISLLYKHLPGGQVLSHIGANPLNKPLNILYRLGQVPKHLHIKNHYKRNVDFFC